mgnify:CR=1 FL=1
MVKAIITTRRLLSEEGVTTCEPDMMDLTTGEVVCPAIRFTVAIVGTASVPHTEETLQ